ncbi:MAG: hypothetical protein WD850_01135 [Candidatus Spechtbacterales bacterium]
MANPNWQLDVLSRTGKNEEVVKVQSFAKQRNAASEGEVLHLLLDGEEVDSKPTGEDTQITWDEVTVPSGKHSFQVVDSDGNRSPLRAIVIAGEKKDSQEAKLEWSYDFLGPPDDPESQWLEISVRNAKTKEPVKDHRVSLHDPLFQEENERIKRKDTDEDGRVEFILTRGEQARPIIIFVRGTSNPELHTVVRPNVEEQIRQKTERNIPVPTN